MKFSLVMLSGILATMENVVAGAVLLLLDYRAIWYCSSSVEAPEICVLSFVDEDSLGTVLLIPRMASSVLLTRSSQSADPAPGYPSTRHSLVLEMLE